MVRVLPERRKIPRVDVRGEPDHVWLRAVGQSLFGERWLRPFAHALGIRHTSLLPLVREEDPRPLTPNMRERVDFFLNECLDDLVQQHRNRMSLVVDAREHFGPSGPTRKPTDGSNAT